MTMVRDAKKSCPEEGLDHARSQNVGSQISEEPGGHDGRTFSRHPETAAPSKPLPGLALAHRSNHQRAHGGIPVRHRLRSSQHQRPDWSL
jgi:hypothetical protein